MKFQFGCVLSALVFTVGCGGSPTAPTTSKPAAADPVSAPAPANAPTPASAEAAEYSHEVWIEGGPPNIQCPGAAVRQVPDNGTKMVFHVKVNNSDINMDTRAMIHYGGSNDCSGTTKDPRTLDFLPGSVTTYTVGKSGSYDVTIDLRNLRCGHDAQIDLGGIEMDSRQEAPGKLAYGNVVHALPAPNCTPDPAPDAPPAPPTPATPTPPITPAAVCPGGNNSIILLGPIGSGKSFNGGTATFSIAPGCTNVVVTLVAFEKTGTDFLPQLKKASATGVFNAGGPYQLSVPIPRCPMQVDLMRGEFNYQYLDGSNFDSDVNPRTVDWIYSNPPCPAN